MKSKSFELKQKTPKKDKNNKSFDFTSYYKTTAETNLAIGHAESNENINKENKIVPKSKNGSPNCERSPNTKKRGFEQLNVSRIDIDGPSLNASLVNPTPLNDSKLTSTPHASNKTSSQSPKVKSIMKNKSFRGDFDSGDESNYTQEISVSKPKKRNKSVSFMLDDSEEVAFKKTKSNESINSKKPGGTKSSKTDIPKEANKDKKQKKEKKAGKENKKNENDTVETESSIKKAKKVISKTLPKDSAATNIPSSVTNDTSLTSNLDKKENINQKRKFKKMKKQNSDENSEATNEESNNNENQAENKNKKKKKNVQKPQFMVASAGEELPSKVDKMDVKPEAIVENLESLSIGDNAHTLTNLLDDMSVSEKDKRKKIKRKLKKDKNLPKEKKQTPSNSSSETADLENKDEGKEKIKWKKRKWNKDKKGDVDAEVPTSVIVDNLPLSIMCSYKKLLSDHFENCGQIKKIGIAEVYPSEDSKPVFTTTINFHTDEAASKALEQDNTTFEGSRIRVRSPLPPTQTTVVVRSYADMTDQAISTTFLPVGRIRNIRHLVKGKKAISTAFIEFDGPEAVENAIKMAQDAKIGGKKMHVSKFEIRKKKREKKPKTSTETEHEGDSGCRGLKKKRKK